MACVTVAIDTTGAPVDTACIRALMDVEPYSRHQARVAIEGSVGLGHVPLGACGGDPQPRTTSSGLSAVFDGRLDDRPSLVGALEATGVRASLADADDVELVLHAFEVWGTDCVAHLVGDFAFAIWNAARRQLFCARDHFGVKPLYYAQAGRHLVVSNVLAGIRRHPAVSDRLRDDAIGDLLLFGVFAEPSHTAFARIFRLPPAHRLIWEEGSGPPRVERYWALEPRDLERYSEPGDYVERFCALFGAAVRDRLRSDRVSVLMSGGLDSSSVAAVACGQISRAAYDRLRAFTIVYESLGQDDERTYSSLVTDSLGITGTLVAADRYVPFERWDGDARPPEPTLEALTAVTCDLLTQASRHGRVALSGDGGDPMLLPSSLVEQIGSVPLTMLAGDLWRARSVSPLGLRTGLARWRADVPHVPAFLAHDLLKAFDPRARWHDVQARRRSIGGPRSRAANDVADPWWTSTFEGLDPGATRCEVELRYPFFDVRLAAFLLQLPSFPWCLNKQILREAMRGRLPEPVRTRPKTPLQGNPHGAGDWTRSRALALFEQTPEIARFVDVASFRATVAHDGLLTERSPGTWAAISLAAWMRCEAGHALPARV